MTHESRGASGHTTTQEVTLRGNDSEHKRQSRAKPLRVAPLRKVFVALAMAKSNLQVFVNGSDV